MFSLVAITYTSPPHPMCVMCVNPFPVKAWFLVLFPRPLYTSPGWLQAASGDQPLLRSICNKYLHDRRSQPGPTLLETRVDPPRPAVIYGISSCKGGLRHQPGLKSSCKCRLTSQPGLRFSLHNAITSQQVVHKAKTTSC